MTEIAATATTTTKKSISLPTTPNLSQLRRPVRSSYRKFNNSQELERKAVGNNIHMPLTYEQFRKNQLQQQQQQKFLENSTSPSLATDQYLPTTSASSSNVNNSSKNLKKFNSPSTRSMLLKQQHILHYEETKPATTRETTTTTSYHLTNDNRKTINNNSSTLSFKTNNAQEFSNIQNNNNNATISNNNNNNNNNNNKMFQNQGCFLQTCSYQNENDQQHYNAITNTSTKSNTINTQQHKIMDSNPKNGGGGFLRCEHCCESISSQRSQTNGQRAGKLYGQNSKSLKSTSLGSDHYQCSDSETVSELSSYRFVTDEDIGLVNKENSSKPLSSSVSLSSSCENENRNKRLTECVSNNDIEENYNDDSNNDLKEYINSTRKIYKNETNYIKNKNEYIPKQQTQQQQEKQLLNEQQQQQKEKRDRFFLDLDHNKTSRASNIQTPTNCCYTIDKSNSDQFIPYAYNSHNNNNNNYPPNNTKPVEIPSTNVKQNNDNLLNDNILSSSLPRNYGSNFETCSFARQLYLRNSLRSQKSAPPVPPKPLTDTREDSNSYDPQKFYRKLEKFEKHTTIIQQQSLPREIPLTRSQERSITPEKCELLNCFPSYRKEKSLNIKHTSEVKDLNRKEEKENGLNINLNNSNYTPKRTLRYDNHGRLKSSFITQLPVTNYRRSSLDNDSAKYSTLSALNLKLTPTLTRKFQYSPKHLITKEINEENEEDIDEDFNKTIINASETSNNNNITNQQTSPLLNSPTSPAYASRSLLPQKKSLSSPIVLHHERCGGGLASPIWLSSETIESHTSSSQKCLDEVQSNCSDQTTIFHFEHDNSTSSSPSSLLYGSGGVIGHQSYNYNQNGGNLFRGPLQVKRLPAIQSFGYIPTQSSSLGSANVREEFENGVSN